MCKSGVNTSKYLKIATVGVTIIERILDDIGETIDKAEMNEEICPEISATISTEIVFIGIATRMAGERLLARLQILKDTTGLEYDTDAATEILLHESNKDND